MKMIRFITGMTMAAVTAFSLSAVPVRAEDAITMISQYRREHGLPAVRTDTRLMTVAQRQAAAMASSGIMDHDVAGSFASRISGANVVAGAENIAAGTRTWADTIRMWKGSPGHNRNLLTPGADLVGVAVARNESTRYKVYWAMVIGRRDSRHWSGRGVDDFANAPTSESTVAGAVGGWVDNAVTSIRSLFH
jgi:uncharacterized protein YkwD